MGLNLDFDGATSTAKQLVGLLGKRANGFEIAICVVLSTGIVHAQTAQMTAQKPAPRATKSIVSADFKKIDPAAVKRGESLFRSNCAFCHGADARGGETGPNLLRSVVVLDDVDGNKIAPIVHGALVSQGMPKFDLPLQQIQDIAAFLHQQIENAALYGTYQILNIVDGNVQAGKAYFYGAGRCSTCHSVTGDLAHIGSKDEPSEIQQKIVNPRGEPTYNSRSPGPDPLIATATLRNGQSFTGVLDHLDDFNVALTDSSGDYRSFTRHGDEPKVVLQDPLAFHDRMLTKYSDAEIHNLTAYLVSLK